LLLYIYEFHHPCLWVTFIKTPALFITGAILAFDIGLATGVVQQPLINSLEEASALEYTYKGYQEPFLRGASSVTGVCAIV